jgi:lysophospholipase L1-like esterase
MVKDARQAPRDLDIVFLGDSMIERWNGTRNMGQQSIPGMRKVFAERFTIKGGGTFEGLALGSSGDTVSLFLRKDDIYDMDIEYPIFRYNSFLTPQTCYCQGPNLLWHLQHGLLDAVNPKIWLILIGTNDLFESRCTDRFVVANILNVLKAIYEQKPDAQFIIHGILPRKDHPESKSQYMGADWKRAQAINWRVRKFCEHSSQLYYMQAGPLFTEETSVRGRRQIDEKLMEDGIHPTVQGLEIWGDYLVKQVKGILGDVEKAKEDAEKAKEDVIEEA